MALHTNCDGIARLLNARDSTLDRRPTRCHHSEGKVAYRPVVDRPDDTTPKKRTRREDADHNANSQEYRQGGGKASHGTTL